MTRSFDLGIALTMTSVVAVALPTAVRGDQEAGGVRIASQCAVQGFQSGSQTLDTPASIPDNTAEGITVGPIVLANGEFLVAEVVVDMSLSHTWVGDVIATLLYDQDSDGDYDVASSVLCRPGREGACNDLGNGDGCNANLLADQIYSFKDFAAPSFPNYCTTDQDILGGCYRPSGLGAGALFYFAGFPGGGRWWLRVADRRAGDTGVLTAWSVHVKSGPPVAVAATPWSRVKVLFH